MLATGVQGRTPRRRSRAAHAGGRRPQAGQGTVEYVALILLIAAVLRGRDRRRPGLKGGGIAKTRGRPAQGGDRGREARQVTADARPWPSAAARMLDAVPARAADPRERPIARLRLRRRRPHGAARAARARCRTRTSCTSATRRASPTASARRRSSSASRCEIAEELLARGAKLLVVACNSATAAALPALRARMLETTLGVDVLGVVRPEAVQAVDDDAQRAHRAAGHAGDGRERRLRARRRRRRPARRPRRGRRARTWRRSSRPARRSTTTCVDTRARLRARRCARPASTP